MLLRCMSWLVIITTEIWFAAARSSKPVRRIIFPWVVFTNMGEI